MCGNQVGGAIAFIIAFFSIEGGVSAAPPHPRVLNASTITGTDLANTTSSPSVQQKTNRLTASEMQELLTWIDDLKETGSYLINLASARAALIQFKLPREDLHLASKTPAELKSVMEGVQQSLTAIIGKARYQIPENVLNRLHSEWTDEEFQELKDLGRAITAEIPRTRVALVGKIEARAELLKKASYLPLYSEFAQIPRMDRELEQQLLAQANPFSIQLLAPQESVGGFAAEFREMLVWKILSMMPFDGFELSVQSQELATLMFNAYAQQAQLLSETTVEMLKLKYKVQRLTETETNPLFRMSDRKPVRIAVIDTGIDFPHLRQEHRELLGPHLVPPSKTGFASYNFADDNTYDFNVFDKSMDEKDTITHGTKTALILAHVISRFAPDELQRDRFKIANWRDVSTTSAVFGGIDVGSIDQIIYEQMEARKGATPPHIISVSQSSNSYQRISQAGKGDLLNKTRSLWVMSAGNDEGADIHKVEIPGCFADFPQEARPSDRILCVGSMRKKSFFEGGGYEVLSHSTVGSAVDVYTVESYVDELGLAPRGSIYGTSFATPAMAAVAAMVKEKFPILTPQKIKKAIINSSESVTANQVRGAIEIANHKKIQVQERLDVRVFDPNRMMKRLFAEAQKLAQ